MKMRSSKVAISLLAAVSASGCSLNPTKEAKQKPPIAVGLEVQLPSKSGPLGLAGGEAVWPVGLLVQIKDSTGKVFAKTLPLSEGSDTSLEFELSPGPIEVQARYLSAGPSAVALGLTAASWQEHACSKPDQVVYQSAYAKSSSVVSESNNTVVLAMGALSDLPLVPGGLKVRPSSGGENAGVVTLTALDPALNLALPAACSGRNLTSEKTSSGLVALRIPLFAEGATPFSYDARQGSLQGDLRFRFSRHHHLKTTCIC